MPAAPPAASPATGLAKRHAAEQAALIADALGHAEPRPGPEQSRARREQDGDRSQSADAGRIDHRGDLGAVAQAARRAGQGRTSRSPASRPTRSRSRCPSPVAGTMGDQLVKVGDNGRGRRGDRARSRPAAAPPPTAKAAAARIDPGQSAGRRARISSPRTTRRARTTTRPHLTLSPAVRRIVLEHHLDPVEDQGHRQGRPPDQGRRAGRRRRPRGRSRPRQRARAARRRAAAAAGPAPASGRRAPRGAGADDAAAADRRPPPQGSAEHAPRSSPPSTTSTCRR